MVITAGPQWTCKHAWNQGSSSVCVVYIFHFSGLTKKLGSSLTGSGKTRHLSSLSFIEWCPECNQPMLLHSTM